MVYEVEEMKSLYLTYDDKDFKLLAGRKKQIEAQVKKRIKWEDFIFIEVLNHYVERSRQNA